MMEKKRRMMKKMKVDDTCTGRSSDDLPVDACD